MSKISSSVFRYAIAFFMGLALSACAVVRQAPPSAPSTPPLPPAPKAQKRTAPLPRQDESPRALASLRLTEQARLLLESGRIDDAVSTLERAMNVNPSNGQTYYYLAEAWLKKGNISQAREFNRLAAMYLREKPEWTRRLEDQKEKLMKR